MSLTSKLRIKTDKPLYLIAVPPSLLQEFSLFDTKTTLPSTGNVHQIVLFAANRKELEDQFEKIFRVISDDCLLWIAYPKKSGSIQSDLTSNDSWEKIYQSGWQSVSSISVDENWSAVRFRHASMMKNMKRTVPMEERKTEGIDYVNRIVTLPEDAIKAMKKYQGLEAFFLLHVIHP